MKGMDLLPMPDAAVEKLGSIMEVITAKHLVAVPGGVVEELRGAILVTISGHLIGDFKGLLKEADDIPRLLEYAHRLDTKYATMSEYKTRSLVITVLRQASVLNLYSYRTYTGEVGRVICSPHTRVQPKDAVLDVGTEYLGREYSYSGWGKTAVREADTDTNGTLMIFTVYFCFLSGIALNMLPQSRGQVSVVFRGLPFPAVFQSSFVLAISLALSAACGALIARGSSTFKTFYAYLAALSMAAAAILLLSSFSSLLYYAYVFG